MNRTTAIAIAALLSLVLILSCALVRVENQRYALQIGMCSRPEGAVGNEPWDYACLTKVQTRTGWWWHLFYAVKETL